MVICAAALALAACAPARKSALPAARAVAVDSLARAKVDRPRDDSAATVSALDARLRGLDSARAVPGGASGLYLLALDNFLAEAGGDPRAPEVMLWKANHLYNLGAYDSAVAAYRALRTRYPKSPQAGEASQMVAQAYDQKGDHGAAERWYRELLAQAPAGDTALRARLSQTVYLQAEAAEKAGRWREASLAYERAAREFPAAALAPAALFNAGVMREKEKDFAQAIRVYLAFFDAYYESDLLGRVQFREAKCREELGQWDSAAIKYQNLAKAHPSSAEAEPALYNAGFAWENAKRPEAAAQAFEAYARRFPKATEAPNLLFRASDLYASLKQWDRVSELQGLFARTYAGDRGRLIQSMVLGGTALYRQERLPEAREALGRAVAEYARLPAPDATSRYYAAQARFTLAEMDAAAARALAVDPNPARYPESVRRRTAALRQAIGAYAAVLDYRIADWALRAAQALGRAFEDYGDEIMAKRRPEPADPAARARQAGEDAQAAGVAFAKAMDQYLQAARVAERQGLRNTWADEARAGAVRCARRAVGAYLSMAGQEASRIPQAAGVEAEIDGRLDAAQRAEAWQERASQTAEAFLAAAPGIRADSAAVDSLSDRLLSSHLRLARAYLSTADLARGAPIPPAYTPAEAFFYKAKLLQDGLPALEKSGRQALERGLALSKSGHGGAAPLADSLREELGRLLYVHAKCFDLLAQEAISHPPESRDSDPARRQAALRKIETLGYELQDRALDGYRVLVAKAVAGDAPVRWAKPAFARLYQVEPDKWGKPTVGDTVVEVATGPRWRCARGAGDWPDKPGPEWIRARRGLVPSGLPYPEAARATMAFIWGGEEGAGPKVDTAASRYAPWPALRGFAEFDWPSAPLDAELEAAGPGTWTLWLDGDTLATSAECKGPWAKGVTAKVLGRLKSALRAPEGAFHRLRLSAAVAEPARGYGVWARLRLRCRAERLGPVYPWDGSSPGAEELRALREERVEIPNFTGGSGRGGADAAPGAAKG